MGGYKADNFKNFDICIKEDIFKIMYALNFQQKQIEVILQSMENLTYSRTDDKAVLSSMTQIKRFIENGVYDGDDIIDINNKINSIPLKALGFSTSNEKFIELLKDNIYLSQTR